MQLYQGLSIVYKLFKLATIYCRIKSSCFKKDMVQKSLLFPFLFCWHLLVFPQNSDIFFERLGVERGLSQASGNAITQDKDGFIWVATQDGVNRFDGYQFTVYRNDIYKAISSNFIQHVAADSAGNVWIATNNGVCIRRYRDGKIIAARDFLNFESQLDSIPVYKILFTGSDDHWFLTFKKELWHWSKRKNLLTHCFRQNGFNNKVWDIIKKDTGGIYFCAENTVLSLEGSLQEARLIWSLPVDNAEIRALASNSRYLYAGTFKNGLFRYDFRSNQVKIYQSYEGNDSSLISNNINRLITDKDERLLVGTREGLCLLKSGEDKFAQSRYSASDQFSLTKNFVLSFFKDREQNVWVGLSGGGVCKYDPYRQNFGLIRNDPVRNNSLSDNMVFHIKGSEKYIFFATQSGGLSVYNRMTKGFVNYRKIDRQPRSLLHNNIYSFSPDEHGNLWLATWGGLCKFMHGKPSSDAFLNFPDPDNLKTNFYSIHKISNQQKLLVSGVNGLFFFDINTMKWLPWGNSVPAALQKITFRSMYEADNGQIWMGSLNNGLVRFNVYTGEYSIYNNDSSLQKNTIRKIVPDNKGNLWLGTDKGILLFDTRLLRIINCWQVKHGLPSNVVYSMEYDNSGRLWISTNAGIAVYDANKNSFRNFDINDGLQANEFNTSASYKDSDGTLYFGGINGVSFFKPESLYEIKSRPEVFITAIRLFNKDLKTDSVPERIKKLDLWYNENFLSFDFTAINYSQSEKNRYAWIMEGLEKNWNYGGSRHYTSYTDLKPGKYILKIKAAGPDGTWSDKITSLHININPPFWNALWFYVSCTVLLAAIIYSLFRYRINQLKKLIAVRTKISQDLHDEIGATLSGISMYTHLAKEQIRAVHLSEVEKSLDVMQQSAGEMVNKLNDIVWLINPQKDSLKKLLEKLEEYAASIATAKNMKVRINIPQHVNEVKLSMETRRNIYLLYKEAINNAVKYSGASLLELNVYSFDHSIELTLEDNGRGFNSDTVKKGNGMQNMQIRAEEIRAEFALTSNPGGGTTVSLKYKIT